MIRFIAGVAVNIAELDIIKFYYNRHTYYTLFVIILWTIIDQIPIGRLFYIHNKNFSAYDEKVDEESTEESIAISINESASQLDHYNYD